MQELIHGERWKTFPLSRKALEYPAMLGEEERRVLAFLACHLASTTGKIVDLGCYLGGSTTALVDGVRQSGVACDFSDPIVVSYDLFIANEVMVQHSLGRFGVKCGESFYPVFRDQLGDDAAYVSAVPGDIRLQRWGARPIDLLFVDILWDWNINQHVIAQFYSALIPGRSVVAHQDYIYSWYPWLPISMEYFCERGYFEFGDLAKCSTVIFKAKRPLDEAALAIDFQRDLTLESKEKLVLRSAQRFSGYPRALLELSHVWLLAREELQEQALPLLRDIARRYADDPVAMEHVKIIQNDPSWAKAGIIPTIEQPRARRLYWKALWQRMAQMRRKWTATRAWRAKSTDRFTRS
jgi:hypothetical protein